MGTDRHLRHLTRTINFRQNPVFTRHVFFLILSLLFSCPCPRDWQRKNLHLASESAWCWKRKVCHAYVQCGFPLKSFCILRCLGVGLSIDTVRTVACSGALLCRHSRNVMGFLNREVQEWVATEWVLWANEWLMKENSATVSITGKWW